MSVGTLRLGSFFFGGTDNKYRGVLKTNIGVLKQKIGALKTHIGVLNKESAYIFVQYPNPTGY